MNTITQPLAKLRHYSFLWLFSFPFRLMPLTEFKDVLLSFDPSESSIMLLILHILTPWYVSKASLFPLGKCEAVPCASYLPIPQLHARRAVRGSDNPAEEQAIGQDVQQPVVVLPTHYTWIPSWFYLKKPSKVNSPVSISPWTAAGPLRCQLWKLAHSSDIRHVLSRC